MPFNNPIIGTGFGTLLRTSIRSLVQTTTLGWSINTDGTATFITVNATSLIGQILRLTGLQSGTTFSYWLFDTPFGNGILLDWNSATQTWTLTVSRIVGNSQIFNWTDNTGAPVLLQNTGIPIPYGEAGRVVTSSPGGTPSITGTVTFTTPFATGVTPRVVLTARAFTDNTSVVLNTTGTPSNTGFSWRYAFASGTNIGATGAGIIFDWHAYTPDS